MINHILFCLIHRPNYTTPLPSQPKVRSTNLYLEKMLLEELLHRVSVPLVDSQRLLHFAVLIQQCNNWIGASGITDLESGEC